MLDDVEQQNGGHALPQARVQHREIRGREAKARDILVNPRMAEVASIGIETRLAQNANVVTSAGADFQDGVALPAKGLDVTLDDVAAGLVPIMRLIAVGIGFVIFTAAEFGPGGGMGIGRRFHSIIFQLLSRAPESDRLAEIAIVAFHSTHG